MQALWADGWFYISSAGLLVSGALFFFLLGQYRAAADAVDVHEPAAETEAEPRALPVRPVYVPDEDAAAPKVASVASAAERTEPRTAASTPRESATGGISPAVVYLQNIQTHLYELHGEIRDLGERLKAVSSRDEALIERLGELSQAVAELRSAAPAAAEPAPAPKRARKAEPKPEPEPEPAVAAAPETKPAPEPAAPAPAPAVEIAPAPETKPEPVVEAKPAPKPKAKGIYEPEPTPEPEPVVETRKAASPDETIRLELGTALGVPSSKPAGETPAAEPEDKPRRGPVWPV